jgi:carbon monoxide dehydrogenase subunit G
MITVERTFIVDRPARVVFAYLEDFTNTEQWDPGTVSCTRTDSGPLEVGAKFHNVSKFRGKESELEYELTASDPDTHLIFVGKNSTVTSTDDITMRADGERTSLTYHAQFEFHGLAKLAQPLLGSTFEKLADDTVVQMTRTLEAL